MKHLDLFSGIGGFSLAAQRVWKDEHKIVAFCEIDKFCQKVLRKHWPDVPIIEDIHDLKGDELEAVELITGGYPCQPFSFAGKQRGTEDVRYLWPEMFRVIKETGPDWIIVENVAGVVNMDLDTMLTDLESEEYSTQTFIIPACSVNAPHRRNRVWIVAYNDGHGCARPWVHKRRGQEGEGAPYHSRGGENVADTDSDGLGRVLWKAGQRADRTQQWKNLNGEGVGDGRKGPTCEDMANSTCTPWDRKTQGEQQSTVGRRNSQSREIPCDPSSKRLPNWAGGKMEEPKPITEFERPDGREIERDFRGMAHGVSSRMDRLKGLGNAIVPQVAEVIMRTIFTVRTTMSYPEKMP